MQCAPIFDQCQVIWQDALSLQIMLEIMVCFAGSPPQSYKCECIGTNSNIAKVWDRGKSEVSFLQGTL